MHFKATRFIELCLRRICGVANQINKIALLITNSQNKNKTQQRYKE